MTQTFQGPDGQQYGFPDDMSMDDIKGVFQKKFGGPGQAPAGGSSTPPTDQSSAGFSSGLLNRLAQPFQGMGQAAADYARTIPDTAFLHLPDRLASAMPTWAGGTGRTFAQEQALTAEANKRLGAMAYPAAAIGYYANPVSDVGALAKGAGFAGRAGMQALEGGLYGTGEGIVSGDSPAEIVRKGGVNALVNAGVGTGMNLASKAIGNVKPYLPTAQQFKDAADSMWDATKSVFDRNSMSTLSNRVQSGFNNTGRPYSQKVPDLMDDIANKVKPGGADARDVIGLQNRADKLKGDDATYGKMISDHIEDSINAHPSGPAIQQARAADTLSKNYDEISANPPSGYGQWLANQVSGHAFRLGREAPFIGALTAAEGAHQMGYSGLAHTLLALGTTVPAAGWAAENTSALLKNRARDAALRDLTGTTGTPRFDPSAQDSFRKLVFGGTTQEPYQ